MADTKRIIIGSEISDERKIELDQLGAKYTVPVSLYDASGVIITSFASAAPTIATVANVTMTDANTEYSYALPSATKTYRIKLRAQNASFKLAFINGNSGTTYTTVNSNASYGESGVSLTGVTLYFQSPVAAQTMEIISYQ